MVTPDLLSRWILAVVLLILTVVIILVAVHDKTGTGSNNGMGGNQPINPAISQSIDRPKLQYLVTLIIQLNAGTFTSGSTPML